MFAYAYPTFRNNNYPLAQTKEPATEQPEAPSSVIYDNGSFIYPRIKTHHGVKTTIQHWQLRNLIRCPTSHTILHPIQNGLNIYDSKTGQDTPLLSDLSFTPTAIDAGYGYIALAGQRGMVMLRSLTSDWSRDFTAGPGINNSVSLSRYRDQIRVIVCNNDHTVTVMTVPDMVKIATIKMACAINHTSVSPDGRKMLMVGDNGKAYMYNVTESGEFEEGSSYQVSDEPALSCAWNHSSEKFAIASQDGYVTVYSTLRSEPLCRIQSSETRKTRKAPRSIQFSNGPLDLLVYAEHVSTVNIVDTRTFETRQIVRLSPSDVDYHVTGFSFSPDNRAIYVGLEDAIVELNVDVCARRRFAEPSLL
ncbi:hypothetical protein VTP01DRAFT_9936 [Rhizomucor pusillus]|uniref:uncharacterized protein n=1 Tax=Rhizomucor pusillus TaxID=4840 RepID=UPI0037438953